MSLRKIAANFMRDQLGANLRNIGEKLESIKDLKERTNGDLHDTQASRIDSLTSWQRRAERTLPLILRMIDRGDA